MIGIDLILRDIWESCGEQTFGALFGAADDRDPFEGARRQLAERVTSQASLIDWLDGELGKAAVRDIVAHLGLEPDTTDDRRQLIISWLSRRGLKALKPAARPQQVVAMLQESTLEARSAPEKFDAARLMSTGLGALLRYIAFYFQEPLSQRAGMGAGDWCSRIETASLQTLCELLDIADSVPARPYRNDPQQVVVLGSVIAHDALVELAKLSETSSDPSAEVSLRFANGVARLLESWLDDVELIPKGCAVSSYTGDPWKQVVDCIDEKGSPLRLLGLSPPAVGATIMVSVAESFEIYAPHAAPVPVSEPWRMPPMLEDKEWNPELRDQVFVSYSHKDSIYLKDLEAVLTPFITSGSITCWSDRDIQPGADWSVDIARSLARARVGVLLVSKSFLASKFIMEKELPSLLAAAESGRVRILWILVGNCGWKETPVARFQSVYPAQRALNSMRPWQREEAWTRICEEIKRAHNAEV